VRIWMVMVWRTLLGGMTRRVGCSSIRGRGRVVRLCSLPPSKSARGG